MRFGKGAPYVFKLFPAMLQVHAEMQQAGLPENEMYAAVLPRPRHVCLYPWR